MFGKMNEDQKNVVRTIEDAVQQVKNSPGDPTIQRLYFLEGSGGTGKTYVYEVIPNYAFQLDKYICRV